MNQLTIAKHYLEELLQRRTDIVAALCGYADQTSLGAKGQIAELLFKATEELVTLTL